MFHRTYSPPARGGRFWICSKSSTFTTTQLIGSPTPVTSPVVVIGREQSTNLSRHSVILQQKTLTGGCGKRGCQEGLGKTEREVGETERVEWIGGVQQVEISFCDFCWRVFMKEMNVEAWWGDKKKKKIRPRIKTIRPWKINSESRWKMCRWLWIMDEDTRK